MWEILFELKYARVLNCSNLLISGRYSLANISSIIVVGAIALNMIGVAGYMHRHLESVSFLIQRSSIFIEFMSCSMQNTSKAAETITAG